MEAGIEQDIEIMEALRVVELTCLVSAGYSVPMRQRRAFAFAQLEDLPREVQQPLQAVPSRLVYVERLTILYPP